MHTKLLMREKSSVRPVSRRKAEVAAWLQDILAKEGIKPPTFAKRMNGAVSASTLYRILDPEDAFVPQESTIERIEERTGYRMRSGGELARVGFSEEGSERLEGETAGEIAPTSPSQSTWRLGGRAVELAGYLPGDLLLVDQSVAPRAGDLVCAQIYDVQRGSAETVFRLFEPPYLTTRTLDPASHAKPQLIDGERCVVLGTVIRMLRRRPNGESFT